MNNLTFNLAMNARYIGRVPSMWGQYGELTYPAADRIDPSDAAASAFWITNANNRIIGNAAGGAWVGFHFPVLWLPFGESKIDPPSADYVPSQVLGMVFDGNTAHSTYSSEYLGAVFFGSRWELNTSKPYFRPGDPIDGRAWARGKITNTKTWLSSWGIISWSLLSAVGFEVWDSLGGIIVRNGLVNNGIIGHTSVLPVALPLAEANGARHRRGTEIHETWQNIVYSNVTFRNFRGPVSTVPDWNRMFCLSVRAGQSRPLFALSGFKFENVDMAARFVHVGGPDRTYITFHDFDGSLGVHPQGLPSWISVDHPHWNHFSNCAFNSTYSAWACPSAPHRAPTRVGISNSVNRVAVNVTRCTDSRNASYALGAEYPAGISWHSGECLYAWFPGTSPSNITIAFYGLNRTATSVVVFSKPPSARNVSVTLSNYYGDPRPVNVTEVPSLLHLVSRNSTLPRFRYFKPVSLAHVYVQLRDWFESSALDLPFGSTRSVHVPPGAPVVYINLVFDCGGSGDCGNPVVDPPPSMISVFDAAAQEAGLI